MGVSLSRLLLLVVFLAGVPQAVRSTRYGPSGLASDFVFYVRCALVLTTLLSFVALVVVALALLRLSHLIVNAGPRRLGAIMWYVAVANVAESPGAA